MKASLFCVWLVLACCASLDGQSGPGLPGENPAQFAQRGCPTNAQSIPVDGTPISQTDFLEFKVVAAFSPMGPYRIRVYGDGRVEREMTQCAVHPGGSTIRVSPDAAQTVLNRARDGGFRQLCSMYRFVPRPGLRVDGDETALTLSLHGQAKTVVNSLGRPPSLYNELADAIEKMSPMGELKAECDGKIGK